MSRTRIVLAVTAAALALSVGVALAQEGGGRRGGGWGGRGGGWDPEQMRERIMRGYQGMLDASDEDWVALEPLVANVMELQRETRVRGMGFMWGGRGGRRGRRGGGDGQPEEEQSAFQKAAADLQETLEDEQASAEVIQEKLTAYRAAREEARQKLAKAQEQLREVLSVRQEAACVMAGLLE